MNITEQIEDGLRELKTLKPVERTHKLKVVSNQIYRYTKDLNINSFRRELIISFFTIGDYPRTTQNRHIKTILDFMRLNGQITDGKTLKQYKQRRANVLKSKDFDSYTALMSNNGFNTVDYFVFKKDKNGTPRRFKVGTSQINGLSIDEENDDNSINERGQIIPKFDLSVLRQTVPRRKQGVYSYGNKSISVDKFQRKIKCFKVV